MSKGGGDGIVTSPQWPWDYSRIKGNSAEMVCNGNGSGSGIIKEVAEVAVVQQHHRSGAAPALHWPKQRHSIECGNITAASQ